MAENHDVSIARVISQDIAVVETRWQLQIKKWSQGIQQRSLLLTIYP